MSWQTPGYYASQKKSLRPGTYLRLHENRWTTSEQIFPTNELWDACVDAAHHPAPFSREAVFVGVDLGMKHDNAARVAVKWADAGEKFDFGLAQDLEANTGRAP
ncbi:MAG TPA: hypothetical protein VK603_18200, partial [Candidatus Saccharimonadales bacterium]|nr:hypothetical protein [Candidatus Saccharimonadales bacterium]